ncbi:cytochrome c oxidase copper chaperone [Condylostylus longicornis]|uniref:cytochrome c oxidase copper chaperone n=1 Tax=Condylostylus longicornis TaxID=2530218 RepID=UPI00244DEA3D|nr:cytochrome c oxidase copper chaperone [Condylostylus longicornis]
MGNAATKEAVEGVKSPAIANPVVVPQKEGEKKKCKACCACPETKKVRDQCIMERGEANCSTEIEAHKKCMRDMGFNV